MRIDSIAQLAARVVDGDTDVAVLPDGSDQTPTQEQAQQSSPQPAEEASTTLAVMTREGARLARHFDREPRPRLIGRAIPHSVASVREPLDAAPPVPVMALPPLAASAPAPASAPPAATAYVGEPPVDPQWLADREKALVAIRGDYEAARAQAKTTVGAGPGWVAAATVTDESGQLRSASGRELAFVPDSNAPQVIAGYDESGPIYQPNGRWMEFDEDAFAAHFRAQGGSQLQALASLYGTDVPGLFAQHPEIWRIATTEHAINAGPAPAGRAMGDPGQLGMLDLYMADPQVAALIDAYGGHPAPASGDIAREQVRIHGQQRYEQLSRLDHAMASVRNQYTEALSRAQSSGSGPGWIERARTITISDESGLQTTQTLYVTDESGQPLRDPAGQPQAVMERVFDPDAFTAWYTQQDGLQHQAFKSFYGQSHTTFGTDESGRTIATGIAFDNPNWSVFGPGGQMHHKDLRGINPNDPPRLHDRGAVGFDLEVGWATAHGNIKQKRDWFETVVQVAMVAVVSYVSAGTLGPAAAGAMGLTTTTAAGATMLTAAGTVVSAAVAGAATSVASGMISGNLTFKGVLQGALAGGLSAGLMTQLGPWAAGVGPVGTIALRTTVQGGIQALLGGEFKDGALAGFAGSLADLAGANMQANIDKSLADGTMSATQAASARVFARVVGSAIRAAGNPNDPAHAFGSAFLGDTLNQLGVQPVSRTAFDDEGNLMPGIVDPNATPQQQQAQLQAQLEQQGFSADHAGALAAQHFDRNVAVSYPVSPGGPGSEPPPSQRSWEMTRQDGEGRIVERAIWIGDLKALGYRSEIPGQYTLELGHEHALARGADGQLQLIAADQAANGSWTVVVPPGQALVTNGLQSIALPDGANPQTMSLAAALTAPLALPQGVALGDAAAALGRTVIGWGPAALRGLGTVGLALWPSSLGGGETVVALNDNMRIVKDTSDVILGHLELRDESGQWQRIQDRQYSPYEVSALLATQRTSMLTPEELQQLTGPMINVPPPPAGPGVIVTPPLNPEDRELIDGPLTTPIAPPEPTIIPGSPMEPQTIDELIVTSRGFEPGTAAHKAATWDYYKDRGGEWEYDRWASVYDANQTRATQAHAAADRYYQTLGWGTREVTVTLNVDGEPTSRRLDIADPATRRAIEYKTGYQTATAENLWEVARDAELVRRDWDVQWVFRDRPSQPLLDALDRAGIRYKLGE